MLNDTNSINIDDNPLAIFHILLEMLQLKWDTI